MNVVSRIIDQLVDLHVIVPDSTVSKKDIDIKEYMKCSLEQMSFK